MKWNEILARIASFHSEHFRIVSFSSLFIGWFELNDVCLMTVADLKCAQMENHLAGTEFRFRFSAHTTARAQISRHRSEIGLRLLLHRGCGFFYFCFSLLGAAVDRAIRSRAIDECVGPLLACYMNKRAPSMHKWKSATTATTKPAIKERETHWMR